MTLKGSQTYFLEKQNLLILINMSIRPKQDILERLAYRYYLKNKNRSSEENWKKAEILLKRLEKRYKNAKSKS